MAKSLCQLLIKVKDALVAIFLKSQECLLTLFKKLKFSRKFPDLQYMQASKDLLSLRVPRGLSEPSLLGYIRRIKTTFVGPIVLLIFLGGF